MIEVTHPVIGKEGEMNKNRWIDVMEHDAPLTPAEIEAGWHFCADWDGLLVGPGMGELRACVCDWGDPVMNERMKKLRAEVEPTHE